MKTKQYYYSIDLNERGYFLASVSDENDNIVYSIDGYQIFEDGFMNHEEDICNLADYLRDMNIMPHNSELSFG